MTELDKLLLKKIDMKLLNKHPNNHKRREYVRSLVTKDLLQELVNDGCSANHIAKDILFNIGYTTQADTIINMCKEFNIKTFSIKESNNLTKTKLKRESTNLIKYGKNNCLSKGTSAYNKRNKTVKNKYGVTNVFCLNSIKEKSKNTMMARYGVTSPILLKSHPSNGRVSKIHKKVEEYLKSINISYESEVNNKFTKLNSYMDKVYSPRVDILLEQYKLVIEINGDRWHANPKVYKDTDYIRLYRGLLTAKEIRDMDKARKDQIESFGYKVLVLWEYDINNNFNYIKRIIYEHAENKIN